VAEIRTGLNHARAVASGGEDDRYLIVGGADSGGVKVFERVEGGRGLEMIVELVDIEKPTSFVWL